MSEAEGLRIDFVKHLVGRHPHPSRPFASLKVTACKLRLYHYFRISLVTMVPTPPKLGDSKAEWHPAPPATTS